MEAIEIRAAVPGDAEAVATYHARCFANTYSAALMSGEITAPNPMGTKQQLSEWFQPGSGFETLVAVLAGLPIGHVTVAGHQLVHLFVDPGHQGTGLGRQLLALGESLLTANGHSEFELHVRVENLNAQSFYEAAGWVTTNRLIHTVEHGINYDEYIFVKQPS